MAGVDQLLQDPRQALLGDLKDVEKFSDRQAWAAIDEVEDPVMRPPKP
jgi:hypothetical protein